MTRNEPFREGRWNVSTYNFDPAVRAEMRLPDSVEVVDLTLREGRQIAGVSLRMEEVLEYARRIAATGIKTIEMHHHEPEEIRQVKKLDLGLRIQALVHPTASLNPTQCREEIDHNVDVGADIVCLSVAVSDFNHRLVESMGGLSMSREEAIDAVCESIQYGKDRGAIVNVLLMDFSRLALERLTKIARQVAEAGADILRLDDICAPCLPAVYRHHAREVKRVIGSTRLAIHSHDDFGLALAGQLAALEGGADIVEGCVNGMGERAGIPNLAILASTLEVLYGYDTGVRLDQMKDLSDWVADVWKQPVPARYPAVGRNAFSHAVEVHYVLPAGDEWAFNSWAPAVVGNDAYVPLCHFSGPMAIRTKARNLGLGELTVDQASVALGRVREELRLRRAELSDRLFAEIVRAAGRA
ncbi:MAG: hypothetical protein IT307_05965 [Chloroflexi bacterium]|nr:hypothetical protein [Chloroflexota bacterium]